MYASLAALQIIKHHPQVAIIVGDKDQYTTGTKTITLTPPNFAGTTVHAYCTATHEAQHAIQHHRWPWLFALHQLWFFMYPIHLFLEAHASYTAYQWMVKNLPMDPHHKATARKLFFKAWLTYLWPFQTSITFFMLLLLSCTATKPVTHKARYESESNKQLNQWLDAEHPRKVAPTVPVKRKRGIRF